MPEWMIPRERGRGRDGVRNLGCWQIRSYEKSLCLKNTYLLVAETVSPSTDQIRSAAAALAYLYGLFPADPERCWLKLWLVQGHVQDRRRALPPPPPLPDPLLPDLPNSCARGQQAAASLRDETEKGECRLRSTAASTTQ